MLQDIHKFENELSKYLNVKHVIGRCRQTMAIIPYLIADDIKESDEIIIPPHTSLGTEVEVHKLDALDFDDNLLNYKKNDKNIYTFTFSFNAKG